MELEVRFKAALGESTLSDLYVDGRWSAFVLEDRIRDRKIKHRTAIPAGRYRIVRRYVGRFATNYKRRWRHKSALELLDVPNFKYILIHVGNTIAETSGCLLVGTSRFERDGNYGVGGSVTAYRRLYSAITAVIDSEEVWVTISRDDV